MIILGHIVGLNFAMSEETSVNTHSHLPFDVCSLLAERKERSEYEEVP
jgi:hypothetical protein